MHYLFFEMTVDWQLPTLFVNFRPLMLDKGDLPHAITAWNYLNVLGAWELSSDKNEYSEQCQFLVKHVKSCLTWVNCILQSRPPPSCLWI